MTQTTQPEGKGDLSVKKAILIGHLITTVPVFAIIFGFRWIGLTYFGRQWWLMLIVGFLLAWLWWAIIIPRWQKWAIQKGAPAERLHQMAAATGLVWKRAGAVKKTETRPEDHQ